MAYTGVVISDVLIGSPVFMLAPYTGDCGSIGVLLLASFYLEGESRGRGTGQCFGMGLWVRYELFLIQGESRPMSDACYLYRGESGLLAGCVAAV